MAADLHKWVQHYVSNVAPSDAQDWLAVVRELRVFCHAWLPAAPLCQVWPEDVSTRGGISSFDGALVLQQCVLVGCQADQIKFSEVKERKK